MLALGAAAFAAAVLVLVLSAHLTFFGDSWEFLMNRRDPSVDAILQPHNEHIVVIPVLITELFLRIFGMSSETPEFVLLAVACVASAGLLFVYVSRRVGPWLGLFAAVLLLFFGPAFEVLLWPFEISFVGSALFGLAMLLALERDDRRGDIAAAVFLALSFGFSSLGIAFAVAAAVAVGLSGRESWRRRAFLVVVPVGLYALWYLGWGHNAESHFSLHNVLTSPAYVADAIAAVIGSLSGLGADPINSAADPAWGKAILVALVAVFAYAKYRRPGVPAGFWIVAAAGLTNWFLTAFNQMPGREPASSRYQYAGAIFVLMALANLLQGVRIERRAVLIGGAVTLLALGPNLVLLKNGRDFFETQSVLTRSDTAAIEIARRTVDPEFELGPDVAGTTSLVDVFAGEYLAAVDEYGSPAYTPAELAAAPEEGRRQADIVLARALPLSTVTRLGGYSASAGSQCVELPPGAAASSDVPVLPGITRIEVAPGPHATFSLRRFAEGEYPVATEGADGGSVTALRVPRDEARRPWRLHVEASQQVRVCS